jgi:hypothetical protein
VNVKNRYQEGSLMNKPIMTEINDPEIKDIILRRTKDDKIKELEAKLTEANEEIAQLKSNSFVGDYQIFTHDMLMENGVYQTFQCIRKMVYSYRLSEGHAPKWGDDSYKIDFKSLKLNDLPNMFKNREEEV